MTMSASALGTRTTASQLAGGRCLSTAGEEIVAPRAHDGHPEGEQGEKEMGHDDQRVQLDEYGDPPSTPWRSTVTGSAHAAREPAREPLDAGHADRSRERDETGDEADSAIAVLDERVEFFSGRKDEPQRGQLSHPEPRAGEAHRRARDDDEEERGERDVGK